MKPPLPSLLIVEDNPDDLYILQRAFRQAGTLNLLHHVENGQQAIDYLQGISPYDDRAIHPLPAVVLLDLKLPIRHGLAVLAWIKQQSYLNGVIVIILTSSSEDNDIAQAYDLGVNAFLVKPTGAEKLREIIEALDNFWLKQNKYRILVRGGPKI
jgi:CheY-like chemotaxis protein